MQKRRLTEREKERIARIAREEYLRQHPGANVTAIYVHNITDGRGNPRFSIELDGKDPFDAPRP